MKVKVLNLDGSAGKGDIELSDDVFGLEPRTDILHRVVTWQLESRRGTARPTRERSDVARTGKKYGRQKGGGTARHGDRSAPIFIGGGKAHGARKRDFNPSLNKKVRALGLKMALSARAKDGLVVVDSLELKDAKTKALKGNLDKAGWNGKVLVSDSGTAEIIDVTGEAPVVWLKDEANLAGINGILGDGDRLLVATMSSGALYSASESGELTELARGMEDADGIGIVPGGGYLVSSWPGQIHYTPGDGTFTTLSDTVEAGIMQNDLSMFGDIVISPNWVPGTVTAYRVVR